MPSCGIGKNCALQKKRQKHSYRTNPLTEQSCITKKLGIIWVYNRKVNKLLTEMLLFHNTLQIYYSLLNYSVLNLQKKVSVANFISEGTAICFCCWFELLFFFLRILHYSKPELWNLTHYILRHYCSLTVFSPTHLLSPKNCAMQTNTYLHVWQSLLSEK